MLSNSATTLEPSPVLIVGSVAFDSVETPLGREENVLGGAAVYASVSASFFAPVQIVGVVGTDFPKHHVEFLRARGSIPRACRSQRGRPSAGPASMTMT